MKLESDSLKNVYFWFSDFRVFNVCFWNINQQKRSIIFDGIYICLLLYAWKVVDRKHFAFPLFYSITLFVASTKKRIIRKKGFYSSGKKQIVMSITGRNLIYIGNNPRLNSSIAKISLQARKLESWCVSWRGK